MKANHIGNGAVIVAICVAIAVPLLVWHNASIEAHVRGESLRQQQAAIDALTGANVKRKEEVAGRKTDALTDEQLKELLRLRAEAGALRKQTNAQARLPAEEESPGSPDHEAFVKELGGELIDAAKTIIAELPAAQQKFADQNRGERARQIYELRKYFPNVDGRRMPGLYSFDFVRDQGPQPGDTLILRESGERLVLEGLPTRIYAFSDGQVMDIKAPTKEDADRFFEDWEKQHLNPAPSQGQ